MRSWLNKALKSKTFFCKVVSNKFFIEKVKCLTQSFNLNDTEIFFILVTN